MFGDFAHKGNRRVVVADIESGSAGVAILSLEHDKPAHVEAAYRTVLPFEERTPEQTVAGITTALSESAEKVLADANKRKGGAIAKSYAIVRAPWTRSKTMRALREFPKEERVSREVISSLAKEALAQEKEFDHANLVEANVVRAELNGYPTARPEGKRAHIVVLSTLLSECEGRIRKAAEETLARMSSSKPILRSGTGALLSVLRERSSSHMDYLIVDMTSSATNMIAVHKGAPLDHVLVPEGVRTILKRVAGDGMQEQALSLIRMAAHDHCEDKACEDIKTGMARAEQELIRTFGEAMAHLASARRLPNKLVLTVEPDMADWLSHFFSRIDFTQFTITTQPFSVEVLSAENLKNLVTASDFGKNIDSGLLVAAAFVNSELLNT